MYELASLSAICPPFAEADFLFGGSPVAGIVQIISHFWSYLRKISNDLWMIEEIFRMFNYVKENSENSEIKGWECNL